MITTRPAHEPRTSAETEAVVERFFDRYAEALVARDERLMGELYAVPSLVLFPGNAVVVEDVAQTTQFFASSWKQYEGVREAEHDVAIMGEAPSSIWADVTWTYAGTVRERFCYQLTEGSDGELRVAVLTPMQVA